MSTDVSSAENESGTAVRTARVPKYYRLKKHLLEMTETQAPGTPVPPGRRVRTATMPPKKNPASHAPAPPLDSLLANRALRRFGAVMAVDATGRLSGVITAEQVGRALRDAAS